MMALSLYWIPILSAPPFVQQMIEVVDGLDQMTQAISSYLIIQFFVCIPCVI